MISPVSLERLAVFMARADAGAIHQDALLAVGLARGGEARVDAVVAGDVDLAEDGAEFIGGGAAAILVAVEDRDLHAFGAQLLARWPRPGPKRRR